MPVKSWHILESEECWALLEARHLGRLAFVDQDGPIVLPINYVVVDGVVIFRTDAGSKLAKAETLGVPVIDEVALLRMLPPSNESES